MMEPTTIARPYARATFAFANEHNSVSEWSEFLHTLDAVVKDPDIAALITNPILPKDQIAALVSDGFSAQISPQQESFIKILVETGRLVLSGEIAQLFDADKADKEQCAEVSIQSAQSIDPEQLNNLHRTLEERMKKRISIHQEIDERLIGGAKICVADQVIDGSYKEKLTQLAAELVS